MLHIDLPDNLDSENHLDALLGKSDVARKDLVVEAQGRLAYRNGDWVMLPPYKGSERNLTGNELGNLGEYGLYNLSLDFSQDNNVAADNPEIMDSMQSNFFEIVDGYYNVFLQIQDWVRMAVRNDLFQLSLLLRNIVYYMLFNIQCKHASLYMDNITALYSQSLHKFVSYLKFKI